MRRSTGHLEQQRVAGALGLFDGIFVFRHPKKFVHSQGGLALYVIVSDGDGWDHVSVSVKVACGGKLLEAGRTPTWEEMCWVKDRFFRDDETVIQFHPCASEYVNDHPYVLHLWRSQTRSIELPPSGLVGLTKKRMK